MWYLGTVLGFDEETKEFWVLYDNEDEEYTFSLLEDLEVKIISLGVFCYLHVATCKATLNKY